MELIFATGNNDKYFTAEQVLGSYGIKLMQRDLEVDEIQSENNEIIARDKAAKAFAILKQPVVISDDSWEIPGLNGFPGPYMKSINTWFTPEDLLRLTKDLDNRDVFLIQNVVYQDKDTQQLFTKSIKGLLLPEIRGSIGKANERIISITPDGKSISEVYETDRSALGNIGMVWPEVGEWLQNKMKIRSNKG